MSFGRAGFGPGEIDRSAQQAQRRQSRPDVSASTIKDKTQGAKARLIQDRGFNDASTLTELAAPLQRELKPVFDAAAGLPRVSDSMIDQTDQSVANGLQELLQQQCPAKCERSTFDDLKSFVAELMTADTSEDQAAIPKKYKLMLAIQVADKHLSNPDTGANPSEVREFVESLLREAATEFPKDSGTLKLMTKQMKRKFEAYKAQMGPASSVESQTLSTAMMGQLEVVVVDGAGEPVAEVAPKVKKKVRQRRRRKKTDFLNKKQDHASVEGHNTGSSDDVRAASADAGPVKSDKERAVEKKVRRRRKKGGRVAF